MDLRFNHALELLGRVTKTVANFARQESELSGVLSTKNYQELRRHREAVHKVDTALAAQIAEAEAGAEKTNGRVQASHDKRLGRVKRAHGLLLRTLPNRAQDAKGNWLGELQMRQIRAERNHAAGNKQNDGDYAALSQTLAQQRAVLDGITAQTVKAFSGYGAFAQTLVEPAGQTQVSDAPENFLDDLQTRINGASEQLAKFRALPLPRLFSGVPLPVCIVLALLVGGAVVCARGFVPPLYVAGAVTGGLLVAGCIAAYVTGGNGAKDEATKTGAAILDAFCTLRVSIAAAETRYKSERKRLQSEYDRAFEDIQTKWGTADNVESEFQEKGRRKLEPRG